MLRRAPITCWRSSTSSRRTTEGISSTAGRWPGRWRAPWPPPGERRAPRSPGRPRRRHRPPGPWRPHDPDELQHGVTAEEILGRSQAPADPGKAFDEEAVPRPGMGRPAARTMAATWASSRPDSATTSGRVRARPPRKAITAARPGRPSRNSSRSSTLAPRATRNSSSSSWCAAPGSAGS